MERLAPEIQVLETPRLVLRAIASSDAESVLRICSSLEVAKNMLTAPHPYTPADAQSFLGRCKAMFDQRDGYVWAITKKAPDGNSGEHIGNIGLHCAWDHQHAEVGYTFGVPEWGKGYATEALRAVIAFAFTRTSIVRVHAGYYTRNPASGRVLEKCGFVPEGLRPRMYLKFGEWIDLALVRLFREDWIATNPPGST